MRKHEKGRKNEMKKEENEGLDRFSCEESQNQKLGESILK